MVGEAVQQSPGQAFRAEYLRPLIERQVGGHQDRAPLVALAEDFEQQLGAGLRERHEAEFVDDPIRLAARPDPGHRSCAPAKAGSGSDRRPYLPGRRNGGVGQ